MTLAEKASQSRVVTAEYHPNSCTLEELEILKNKPFDALVVPAIKDEKSDKNPSVESFNKAIQMNKRGFEVVPTCTTRDLSIFLENGITPECLFNLEGIYGNNGIR